ncbi:MAG: lysophospholipid acyltransferase family protein [Burkholderiales bacterium]
MIVARRSLRLALHLLQGVTTAALIYPFCSRLNRRRLVKRWSALLLKHLGVKLTVRGDFCRKNTLLVANHISWLDIYLINAFEPVRFVSKADVRKWPVIGWLASKTGTLFIEREKRSDAVKANQDIARVIAEGDVVAFFPEGTTTRGDTLRPFFASLFQPALAARTQIQPVAIRYLKDGESHDPAPSYADLDTFMDSLKRIVCAPLVRAELVFTPPIDSDGLDRRQLARLAESAIAEALKLEVAGA